MRILKISYSESAYLFTPLSRWKQVDPTIFEICLLFMICKQHLYTYENFENIIFGISILVYPI